MKKIRRRSLSVSLWLLFFLATILAFKSSDDPILEIVRGTFVEGLFLPFSTGNQFIFNASIGFIGGLFIYLLVVWIPERGKRDRVRRNLAAQYDSFKGDCISVYFSAMHESYNSDILENLKDQLIFRKYFKEKISEDKERWHVVLNGLDGHLINRIIVELEILCAEVQYALTVVDIDNAEVFDFMKRLSQIVYRYRNLSDDYDDIKQLSGFLWSIHTGWSFVDGYTEKDVIAEMIEAI